ncbi:RNA polymerase sigma factor [Pseudarthrobacter sp. J1738]|uniref:RNA polymerase sigma factor n=1 Tax=Pseudarthrobacter sp. J1738 TaxID=3420446 RepID=UPI003D287A33
MARRYGPLMRAYARRLTGSAADADDVVQESLLQSWNGLDSLEDPKAVKSWMMRITARRAITLLWSRKPHEPLEPDGGHLADLGAGPERHAVAGAGVEALTKALDRLPAAQRECWVLREMGGHSYEEIAETLGIGVDSVRGRIARARTSLLTEMEAWR